MHWAEPDYLYLLLALPVIIGFLIWRAKVRARDLERFGNPALLSALSESKSPRRGRVKAGLWILGFSLAVIALARPQWGARPTRIERKGVDLVIVLDVSHSMLAQDIKPSRLDKAKHEIGKLIEILSGDRIALVPFAGTAFTLCPLTLDYNAARMFLEGIAPAIVPEAGTAIADALRAGMENFDPKERKYKAMILLTDGEDHGKGKGDDPLAVAEDAAKQGIVIYTIGIGSSQGTPIPIEDEHGEIQYKRDRHGELVMTLLDQESLQKVALATQGKYYHVTAGEIELDKIYQELSRMEKKKFEEEYHIEYEDRFQWFLALAVLGLFLEAIIPERVRRRKRGSG
jgi:Ca-activated chloride channel family protein